MTPDPGIAVVRRNTEEVQGRGNFEVFEELFAIDFVDHTPQPGGFTADRDGARSLYRVLRAHSLILMRRSIGRSPTVTA
jgi:hypothetical protein